MSASRHQPTSSTYLPSLQSHLHKTTSLAHTLPSASSLSFHRSVDPKLATRLDEASGRIWGLLEGLLGAVDKLNDGGGENKKRKRREEDSLVDGYDEVVECVDGLLERADTCLDNFLGKLPPPSITVIPTETARSKNKSINPNASGPSPAGARLPQSITNASISKPQLLFLSPPDNSHPSSQYKVYSPDLTPNFVKRNALVPLSHVEPPSSPTLAPSSTTTGSPRSTPSLVPPHPYHHELTHLPYPPLLLAPTQTSSPTPPKPFAETPFTHVMTLVQFQELVAHLRTCSVIAIDLEHHSYRSFAGFLALMQITTATGGDFVVDLLVPEIRQAMRDEMGVVLSDPSIVKVFHGAESDVVWLQQDFDLFVVGMFDTYHATKALEFPSHSLASLLSMYCDFSPDKRYQMADWRIRPLPQEMLDYARSDTHYLLFIFENLLNALISRSSSSPPPSADGSSTPLPVSAFHPLNASQTPRLLQTVLARSAETCARRYSQEMYDVSLGSGPTGFRLLAKKWGKLPIVDSPSSSSPLAIEGAVYKAVHAWRDRVSREEDESTRWVLPNHQIFVLARQKPRTVRALLTCLQPITEVCRRRGDELVRIIGEGVEEAEGLAGSGGAAMDGVEGVQSREEQEKAKRERERQEERDREGKKETIVADVWGAVAPSATPAAPISMSSSLFGSSLPTTTKASSTTKPDYSTNTSSLFGGNISAPSSSGGMFGSSTPVPASATPATQKDAGFFAALGRISLSINPPPPPTPSAVAPELAALPGPEEVPFVPASARLPKSLDVDSPSNTASSSASATSAPTPIPAKDDIVTVGRPRDRKRKRDKRTTVTAETETGSISYADAEKDEMNVDGEEDARPAAVSGKSKGKAAVVPEEKFDYSSVPNGLDPVRGGAAAAAAASTSVKVKKTRKPKKTQLDTSAFRKAPQSMVENKKGNRSVTFGS